MVFSLVLSDRFGGGGSLRVYKSPHKDRNVCGSCSFV